MSYLLDTQVWIWSMQGRTDKVSASTRARLEQNSDKLFLSPVSVWEAMHLARSSRFKLNETPTRWVQRLLLESRVREAPFTFDIALLSKGLDLPHEDPADRFIVATAKHMGLRLVTSDQVILSAHACETLEA